MQITRDTADTIETLSGGQTFVYDDLANPDLNIRYGTFYLNHLLDRFDGNVVAALAGYNGGPENVEKWGGSDLQIDDIPFPETRSYVEDVLASARVPRQLRRRARALSLIQVDLIVAWLVFPALMLALCAGCGLLVELLAKRRLPTPLVPIAGFAVIVVVGQLFTLADASARLARPRGGVDRRRRSRAGPSGGAGSRSSGPRSPPPRRSCASTRRRSCSRASRRSRGSSSSTTPPRGCR